MTPTQLMEKAKIARENAYAPYSGFRVGAALLCRDGSVFAGCNIENAAYGATNCAERTAIFSAVAQGKREFTAIAICGGREKADTACPPCGICRQALREFCKADFLVYLLDKTEIREYTLEQLLPESFGPEHL